MPPSVIEYLQKSNITLTNLSLYNNPWECNYRAKKLTQILSVNNIYNMQNMRCEIDDALLFKVNFAEKCFDKNSLSKNEI